MYEGNERRGPRQEPAELPHLMPGRGRRAGKGDWERTAKEGGIIRTELTNVIKENQGRLYSHKFNELNPWKTQTSKTYLRENR